MITIRARVDTTDLEQMLRNLEPAQIERVLIKTFRVALNPTIRAARALAPRRTGKLARSIRVQVRTRGGLQVAIVGTPYAHLVEYGHRQVVGGRVIRVGARGIRRIDGVLRGPRGGRYTGRTVGFVRPVPFTRTALAQTMPEIEMAVTQSIDRSLTQATGSAIGLSIVETLA